MRELTNHQATAADLSQQRGLARDALMLGSVADLDEHSAGRAALFIGRDRAIDDELAVAVDRAQRQLTSRERTGRRSPRDR